MIIFLQILGGGGSFSNNLYEKEKLCMKISSKGRYALEALLAVAFYGKGDFISLRDIAISLDISDNYLEQIFAKLRQVGMVESLKGSQGGYRVSPDKMTSTVGDILRILEGNLAPIACLKDLNFDACGMIGNCYTRPYWEDFTCALNEVFDQITLEELLKQFSSKKNS